jgi:DNA-binding IclR family transcriptional regulator
MRIDHTTLCAGHPATLIRDLLGKLGDHPWSVEMVAGRLSLRQTEARALVERLVEIGYVEPDARQPGNWFLTTNEGNRLALASAARPLSRGTADRGLPPSSLASKRCTG